MKTKKWTGERLETHILNDNTIEHLHRYALTFQYIKNKNVLDIACGEGYGSNLMASVAKNVTGVDIDAKAVADAKLKYKKENLTFLEGRADKIPLPDHTVDVVVSFETIEHHDRHQEMMSEIKRVLKKDGVMILSSPDKKNYSDLTGFNNPHHVKELYQHEFESLVKSHFEFTLFLNQRFVVGSFIEAKTENATTVYEGSYNEIRNKGFITPLYIVSIASDALIEKIGSSIFLSDEFINSIIRKVQNSPSFRLGNFLLRPFKIFKK